MANLQVDEIWGAVKHGHLAEDVILSSGTSVETAIASGSIPDNWRNSTTEIRNIVDYDILDDIGNFATAYKYEFRSITNADDGVLYLTPTDIATTITLAAAGAYTADIIVNGVTTNIVAAADIAAFEVALNAVANMTWTKVGLVYTLVATTAGQQIAVTAGANTTDTTAAGRWMAIRIFIDTTLTQTLSNKTLNNIPIKVITIGSANCNYTTIQAALTANATAGAVFLVYPGTYSGDTITFTANNQIIQGVGNYLNTSVLGINAAVVNVGAFTGCFIKGMTVFMAITDGTVRDLITASTGAVAFENAATSVTVTITDIATERQPSVGYITHDGEIHYRENCFVNYDNESDDAGGLAIKAPFVMERNGYVSGIDTTIGIDSTNTSNTIVATAMCNCIGTAGLWGDLNFKRCNIDVDDDRAAYVSGNGYIIATSRSVEEFEDCTFTISRVNTVAATVVTALYNSSAGTARVESYRNNIDVENLETATSAWSYYQAATGTINVYDDNVLYAAGGTTGTITRYKTTHGLIDQVIGNYHYQALLRVFDTVNDRRIINTAGVLTLERCTVAAAGTAKGAGTWVTDFTISTNGDITIGAGLTVTGNLTAKTSALSDWNTITPTAITAGSSTTCGTMVFTGTYEDTLKYNRSLVRCRSAAAAVTTEQVTADYIDHVAHGHKAGDIVYFAGAGIDANLTVGRPYYIRTVAADKYTVALTPAISANITLAGTAANMTAAYVIHGYVDSATITGTDVTLNVSLDYNLSATIADFTNYQVTRIRKIEDFQEYIHTGYVGGVVADGANAQGRLIMDIKKPVYLQSVNSAVGTVAATDCQWWIGGGAAGANPSTSFYSSKTAQAMTTNAKLNYRRPTTSKYVASTTNIGLFIEASTGATLAQKLQIELFLVPIDFIAQ